MEKIDELREKIKQQPENWEREIFKFACSLACRLAEQIFREMDDALKEKEALGMKVVGFREKRVYLFLVTSNSGEGCTGTKRVITTFS